MALSLISDLTVDTASNKQYSLQGILTFGQIDRSFAVAGLTGTDPTQITATAENFVKNHIPVGTPHPTDPLCTARYYQVRSLDSTDFVQVVVSFVYNQGTFTPTIWTIESDSYAEYLETDEQIDNSNRQTDPGFAHYEPIAVKYQPAWTDDSKAPPTSGETLTSYGTVPALKPRKRWTYTKTIYNPADASTFDALTVQYVGAINSVTFTGFKSNPAGNPVYGSFPIIGPGDQSLSCGPGTVLCYDAGVSYAPYQGQYSAQIVMIYKPEGWQPWVRYTNPLLGGVPANIWRKSSYDGTPNGTVQATVQPIMDLNLILSLI